MCVCERDGVMVWDIFECVCGHVCETGVRCMCVCVSYCE